MDNWDEVRTAYQVARMGTVSGAAEVLGVHHATVIRHIDAIESRLAIKLFQRHARGYTPTELAENWLVLDPLGVALEVAPRMFGDRGEDYENVSTWVVVAGCVGWTAFGVGLLAGRFRKLAAV